MQVNRDQFLEQGYAILRKVVPPDRLNAMRGVAETMVERRRKIWAREQGPDDPPEGVYASSPQPRLSVGATPEIIDAKTAEFVEFWCHENSRGVSSRLLDMPGAGNTEMMMMCSPLQPHGPAAWHRDIHPFDTAPLQAYIEDILENGPRYVQWNIPLYDDDVLWVVPGSHVRFNTDEEQEQLNTDPRVPLPNGIQTHLEAGDGVVYITPILHWGSDYSAKLRRTLHGGFSNFNYYTDLKFAEAIAPQARATFESWNSQSLRCQDATEAALRAAIAGDGGAYLQGLDRIQSGLGDKGKWMLTMHLSKAACFVNVNNNPDFNASTQSLHRSAGNAHAITLNWGPDFSRRFTPAESTALWQRFAELDAALQTEDHHVASFQGGAVPYEFNRLPEMDMNSFLAGWGART